MAKFEQWFEDNLHWICLAVIEVVMVYLAITGVVGWYWVLGPIAYVVYILVAGKVLITIERAIVRALERRRVSKKFKDIRKNKEGL